MDLKRAMLLRLAQKDKDLYPNDPDRREIYNRYKVSRILRDMMFYQLLCLSRATCGVKTMFVFVLFL